MAESTERASEVHQRLRRMEILAALAVATGGTYGLSVWIDQVISGPPGPAAER